MNKLRYILSFLILSSLAACKKEAPEVPTFEVSAAQQEYSVGDSVTFSIKGYADIISFYSGEPGKEYRFKDRIESDDSKLHLSFSTQVLYGAQVNNLRLFYSTDFNNTYSTAGIRAATWTDITELFTLGAAANGAVGVVTASGEVDISDLPVPNKPIYFAWRYINQSATSAGVGGRTWRIPIFNLTNKSQSGSVATIATVTTAGWLGVDVENPVNKWTIQTGTPFLYFAPASTLIPSEDWAISRALFPTAVSPDNGIGIKGYLDKMTDYKYTFSAPGTYTVTFVARNANSKGQEEVVKELTVVVK